MSSSARIPSPGPVPVAATRTGEQRTALLGGALFLLACLLSLDLTWRVVTAASDGIVASVIPVVYLAVGWLLFALGLIKLSGEHRRSSARRGPWLVTGLVFALICAPLAASFATAVDERVVTFNCACGSRVKATGRQNCWGHWLTKQVAVIGSTPVGRLASASTGPALCPHAGAFRD